MRLDVVTIFPEYLAPLRLSLIGRAVEDGLIDLRVHDLRDWTSDRHRTVDDTPYGGGPGMLMRPEPWGEALDSVAPPAGPQPRLVVPSPAGEPLTQDLARALAGEEWLFFACGRYEGIDQRVLDGAAERMPVTEVSVGDSCSTGARWRCWWWSRPWPGCCPGVIGNAASLEEESHADGLLEAPGYTKPPAWRGREVPEVLLSGHHGRVQRWRRDQSLRRTAVRRPDLLGATPCRECGPRRPRAARASSAGRRPRRPTARLAAAEPPVAD